MLRTNTVELLTDSIKSGIGIGIGADAKKKKEELDDKLTLGAILEVIDGLVETPGRVIIFTTNHKDSIDPALLRPGRIDMQIEFRKLRRSHIQQIFQKNLQILTVVYLLEESEYLHFLIPMHLVAEMGPGTV